jgi:alkanesulfonate monooxygenase SsuD/methylene tetrahydromethanopterin reductase-like flavin-dependent oxidoreductase (luciferase family)
MEFGIFLLLQSPSARPSQEIFDRGTEIACTADKLGFDSVWLAEHHFSTYGYLSRPLMYALHLANQPQHIRVGTAVVVLPLHNPLVVAEEVATVDLLSNGRFELGLGRGYQHYEFERFGQDLGESRSRWEESVDIMLRAFTGEPFTYEGTHFQIPQTCVLPIPIQRPHPPIWVVGQSPESVAATVRRGFNLVTGGFGVSIDRLREFRASLDELLAQHPPARPIRVSTQRPVFVTNNEADARAAVEQARWNMRVTLSLRQNYGRVEHGRAIPIPFEGEPSTDEMLDSHLVVGTPQTCIERLATLREVMGIDHFAANVWFGDMSREKVLESMHLFASEVMPAFD